jgi:hypothetical protein
VGPRLLPLAVTTAALALGACGGSGAPKVGDCIDGSRAVVACGDASAKQKLVSDQEKSDAIACVEIGDTPQTQVKVQGHEFCAEPK